MEFCDGLFAGKVKEIVEKTYWNPGPGHGLLAILDNTCETHHWIMGTCVRTVSVRWVRSGRSQISLILSVTGPTLTSRGK